MLLSLIVCGLLSHQLCSAPRRDISILCHQRLPHLLIFSTSIMFGGAATFVRVPRLAPAPANNNGGGGVIFVRCNAMKPAATRTLVVRGFSFGATATPSRGYLKPGNGGGGFAFGATLAKPAASGSTNPATGGGGFFIWATPAKPSAPANTANTKPAGSGGFAFAPAPTKQNVTETQEVKPATGVAVSAFGATPAKSTTTGAAPVATTTPGGGAGFSFGGASNNTAATKIVVALMPLATKAVQVFSVKALNRVALTTLGNSTNTNQQKPQAAQSTTTGKAAAKGNNYIRTFDPRGIQQLFFQTLWATPRA